MRVIASVAAGLAVFAVLSTGTARGQGKPACDAQGRAKTAEKVAVSVRESGGTVHEFQATRETLQDLEDTT